MDETHPPQEERRVRRMQANLEELAERIGRAVPEDGVIQPLEGLYLARASEDLDAASAAFRVGYRDASHFNREYKSLFGVPPMHDVQRLREEALNSGG